MRSSNAHGAPWDLRRGMGEGIRGRAKWTRGKGSEKEEEREGLSRYHARNEMGIEVS